MCKAACAPVSDGSKPDARPYLICGVCAIWIPLREDSSASDADTGICPRKFWPQNHTKALDGCYDGVWPME